jgi:P-type conjugative transfer protein TrbJ
MLKRAVGLLLVASAPGMAQFFSFPCITLTPTGGAGPCASENTTILNHIEHVIANITLADSLAQQILTLGNLIKNSARGGASFGQIAQELQTLNTVVMYGRALSYSIDGKALPGAWNSQYPGVGRLGAYPAGTYGATYGGWARTANDSLVGAMLGASAAAQMRQGSAMGILQGIRTLTQAADGWMKMHTAVAMSADLQSEHLLSIHQAQMAQLQASTAMAGYQIQRDAANVNATQQFFTAAKPVSDGMVPGLVPDLY